MPELILDHDEEAASSSAVQASKWRWWRLVLAVVGLAAVLTVAVAVPVLTGTKDPLLLPADQLPRGVHADPSAVPWSAVGPGWLVASWEPHPLRKPVATDLFLVSPSGTLYPLYRLPGDAPTVVDWSDDGKRALFETANSNPETVRPGRYEVVDLQSGIVEGSFRPGDSDQGFPTFTTPHGDSILTNNLNNGVCNPVGVYAYRKEALTPDFKGLDQLSVTSGGAF
jgi:TolB protein